jgi:excinuclease ABC A subunit
MKPDCAIEVVGASINNLQDVDVRLPSNAVTAIVGVSGSGKSSLVDRTIAAAATERTYRFLGIPGAGNAVEVSAFVGATPPAVVVAQRAYQASTRNTVATSTGLLRALRRLFIRHSVPFAGDVGETVPEATPDIVYQWLIRHMTGKVIVWAVPVFRAYTDGIAEIRALADAGIAEAVVYSETDRGKRAETGTSLATSRFKGLRPDVSHTIEAKVGEVRIGDKSAGLLLDLLHTAWRAGSGKIFVETTETRDPALIRTFSYGFDSRRHRVHPKSAKVFRIPDPHLFSFNAPRHEDSGACPHCSGSGIAIDVQEELLVARPERAMHDGAFALWTEKNYRYVNIQHATIEGLRGRDGFDPDMPWKKLPATAKRLILDGSSVPVVDIDPRTRKKASSPHVFPGFRRAILERVARQSTSTEVLKRFVSTGDCPSCGGTRWRFETRALKLGGRSIDEVLAAPFSVLVGWAVDWHAAAKQEARSSAAAREIGTLVENIAHIARAFVKVGLGHLSGSRSLLNVSDGEARRIQLASVLNSRLSGLLLVLDEPGRGLHEADLARLAEAIDDAARLHTVLMSEHRTRLVQHAQQIIQLGPGAGAEGGRVIEGRADDWGSQFKGGALNVAGKTGRAFLEILGASANTVRNQDVRIPLGSFTCIAGVSGSGKSSFVRGVLVPALRERLPESDVNIEDFRVARGTWRECKGVNQIKALYALDQANPSGQARSLVATYLGLADVLRREFASIEQARRLSLSATDFGTNAGRGRCQSCMGLGRHPDGGTCPVCGGLRFGHDALSVRFAGLNIAEWLDLPLSALNGMPFSWLPPALVNSLLELGVGHLSLGRSLSTLSGGEIQRLRLSRAIAVEGRVGAVFVLDEPACGLHPQDVESLYRAIRHVVSGGKNTVIAVEHDPYLLAQCDYLVEFGPDGGPDGGEVIAYGAPEEIRAGHTATGWALTNPVFRPQKAQRPQKSQRTGGQAPAELDEALAARQEIRQILGDDVAPPDEGRASRPGAIFEHKDTLTRSLELGGIDRALISVALEELSGPAAMLENLLQIWKRHPTATLYVNPLLDAVSVWGTSIPATVIDQARHDARAMGLDDFTHDVENPMLLRVSGTRLGLSGSSASDMAVALRDGWALGGGFVDLIDSSGKSIAKATERLFDVESGLVGPRRHHPEHFLRSSLLGCCLMCKGSGAVSEVIERHVIGNPKSTVFAEDFFAPEIAVGLKGFRRNELIPFFRRMTDEGMWRDVAWNRMTSAEKAIVFWGYWVRPGIGTFLKRGRSVDGSEVNHWLMWDGLATKILPSRTSTTDGDRRHSSDHSQRVCPLCEGTGLSKHAKLLLLAGRPVHEWTRDRTVGELLAALEKLKPSNRRQAMELHRVLHCLRPFRSSKSRLNEPVDPKLRLQVLPLIAEAYTGLATFFM